MNYYLVTLQGDLGATNNTRQRTFAVSESPFNYTL